MNRAEKRRQNKLAKKAAKKAKPGQGKINLSEQKTLDIQHILGLALQHHSAGRLLEAESIYHQILQTNPEQPQALHMLGVIASQAGNHDAAVELISKALNFNPVDAEAHFNLGNVLRSLGRQDEAVASYRKALAIAPDYTEAHFNLGNVLNELGRLNEAVVSYNKTLKIAPDYAEVHNNIGNVFKDLRRLDEAVASYCKSLAIEPNSIVALNNLGNALKELGRFDEAVVSYNQALDIDPNYGVAHLNLGNALKEVGRLDEAVANYQKAIAIDPNYANAHTNLGATFKELGRFEEAILSHRKALIIKPNLVEAHENLGNTLQELGRLEDAIHSYDLAGTDFSKAKSLECHYALKRYKDFYLRLDKFIKWEKVNLHISAISAFVSHQLKRDDPYPFCKTPLDFLRVGQMRDHSDNADSLIDRLVKDLKNRDAVWEPYGVTTKFGFQTRDNLFFNPKDDLAELDRIIKGEINSYYSEHKTQSCLFMELWPKELELTGWFVRLMENGHQATHIHPTGWLSGVVYLKLPETLEQNEGAIEFGLHGYGFPILNDNYPRILHHPEKGQIVLFPSSLFHETYPFTTDDERLSIAFDLLPA